MDIQMTAVPRVDTKFGKFTLGYIPQIPYGSAAATAIKNAIRAHQAQPAAAPAGQPAPAPQAPGAILPTQAPTYLFPTTTEQASTTTPPEENNSTTTTIVVFGLSLVTVLVAVALSEERKDR